MEEYGSMHPAGLPQGLVTGSMGITRSFELSQRHILRGYKQEDHRRRLSAMQLHPAQHNLYTRSSVPISSLKSSLPRLSIYSELGLLEWTPLGSIHPHTALGLGGAIAQRAKAQDYSLSQTQVLNISPSDKCDCF